MKTTDRAWARYCETVCVSENIGLTLDVSAMRPAAGFLERMREPMERAFAAMVAIEAGDIANPDEGRMVGHYWLRAPELSPHPALSTAIRQSITDVSAIARAVHEGRVRPERAPQFSDLLVIGIGGSALGPQLVADALGEPGRDRLEPHFLDNTDPDGIARTLAHIGDRLEGTLTLVISKSGGTPETRNGMILARRAYEARGLAFSRHAIAVTGEGSALDQVAATEKWLARLPMWDWVGGRTSVTSAAGLLPAALQGIDIDELLRGARECDEVTRRRSIEANPAALLAVMWHHATGGQGARDMVVIPYKDRLLLLSRYLQQLVMESLGKGRDLAGNDVEQGIAVYGNKGSTDQHAYVQQLREGVNNFFVTFIAVLEDGGAGDEVEPGVTAGDYLRGFLLGTRRALADNGRESMTITVDRASPYTLGVLVALFERAVGLYASLIGVNAYHQPGVEAGKRAAAQVLDLQKRALAHLRTAKGPQSARQLASALGSPDQTLTIHEVLTALAANGRGVVRHGGPSPETVTFEAS